MNKFYKGLVGLTGGLSLFYAANTADVRADNNGGNFPNGVDVVSYADEDSGTLNREATKTLDELIKEKGFIMGLITRLSTVWVDAVPSALYGLTKKIPESKFVVDYPVRTAVDQVKGAIENPADTTLKAAIPMLRNAVDKGMGNGGVSGGSGGQ